jgi:iron-sulfur cluster assembly protein
MSLVNITDAAKEHFVKMMKQNGANAITLVIANSGCNGISFDYEFRLGMPGSISFYFPDDEAVYEFSIEHSAIPYLLGGTIDYIYEGLNTRLNYELPEAHGSCGCGKSFNF